MDGPGPRIVGFDSRFLRDCESLIAALPEPLESLSLSGPAGPAPVFVKRL